VDAVDKVAQQRQLYGEPIKELARRVTDRLGLTQSALAGVLGLSPAMMSQLVHAQRVKIGNPVAVARLQALLGLAEEAPTLTRQDLQDRLATIREARAQLTNPNRGPADPPPAEVLRRVLRAVASGQELDRAAEALDEVSPGLAEVVRVYGTGSTAEATRHFESVAHLLRG
jgi:transcriptional regulator with XRE-family HTH domain